MENRGNPVSVDLAGAFIEPLIKKDQTGKIIGITSKGIFLLFDCQVLFLTDEVHKNPFMLHISTRSDYPQRILLNQEVQIEDQFLSVGEKSYDLRSITRYVPDTLPMHNPAEFRHKSSVHIVTLFHALNLRNHQDSLLYIVDALLAGRELADPLRQNICQAVVQLRNGFRTQKLDVCDAALLSLMGSGKGLTPSGDDLISGYLLIQNSTNLSSASGSNFLPLLNEHVVSMARTKTSWISANLIEASTMRLVDERVGQAARLLLGSCRMDAVTIAGGLESFGNSSGIDAFTGMAAALLP